jgi:hypothetical protein
MIVYLYNNVQKEKISDRTHVIIFVLGIQRLVQHTLARGQKIHLRSLPGKKSGNR